MTFKRTLAAAAALLIAGQASAADYSIDNLTARYGAGITWTAINNSGELIGQNARRGLELRLRSGSVTENPSDSFYGIYPYAFGNDGTAFFSRQTPEDVGLVYRRAPDGSQTVVPSLPNSHYPSGSVWAVNDSGIAVGASVNSVGYVRAVVYQDGKAIDFGAPRGNSYAYSINNSGAIVGNYFVGEYTTEAYLYANGQVTTFGGSYSTAKKINDANVVAGEKIFDNDGPTPSAYTQAFLYENGVTTYISVAGKRNTSVRDLNNAGLLLGWAGNDLSDTGEFFLYSQGTTLLLNEILAAEGYAGWIVEGAGDINDNNQVLVHAFNNATGETRELLLSPALPVPEPGTWAMLLAGLGCVGMLKRRRAATA
jgi:hypothetical protein